jgi:hypothetical protein
VPWARRISKTIPAISSRQLAVEINDYSLGMNSFLSNDKFPMVNGGANLWRLAQDARIPSLGEYESRKGFDFHSDGAGETKDDNQESTTGGADRVFTSLIRRAQKFTTASAGNLTKVDVRLRNNNGGTGTILVELWSDVSSEPGVLISRSSVSPSVLTGSYAYVTARFPDAPAITTTTDYWLVVYVQATGTNSYSWSSTSSGSDSLVSGDSGTTWASEGYALNFKQYYSTTGGVKGLHRAYKSDGTKKTLFVHGTVLYSVDDATGALTTVKSGLNSSATHYRFVTVNDTVYYVNGFDGLRKWNFSAESQVSATNYTHICEHKGLLFLVTALDPNKVVYSNFADYETFTSTDFIYVPSPKTGDPVTALQPLNGYLIIPTLNNKYILSGDDNATFRLDEAPDQKGTYTQETITADKNFIYYLADDGVYKSNGTEAQLLTDNNYQDIVNLANKDGACICINKGRLYLWFKSPGSSANDTCYVWNLNFGRQGAECLESTDVNAFVSRAVTAFRDSDDLLVASSLVGQVFWQEKSSNDYTNLGGDIEFILQTHYMTFDNPAVLKEVRYWQPRFGAQDGDYSISCEYATDLRDNWQVYSSPEVQGAGYLWGDSGTVWGSFTWGTTAEVQAQLYVPGEYRRIALRYKHFATRQPQKFLGHSLVTQVRRMR